MCKDNRLVGCAVNLKRVLHESVYARRQHYALLRRAGEDVATLALAAIKPVGIVERASAQPQNVREPLQIQADRRTTPSAKIQGDALVTGVRSVIIGLRPCSGENDILSSENWLDKEGRSREPLAKRAMADGHPNGLGDRPVADVAA